MLLLLENFYFVVAHLKGKQKGKVSESIVLQNYMKETHTGTALSKMSENVLHSFSTHLTFPPPSPLPSPLPLSSLIPNLPASFFRGQILLRNWDKSLKSFPPC
jgi:hypothetical protein